MEDLPSLEWGLREGAKADQATFETAAGKKAKGKIELRVRGDRLEGKVRLDEVEVEAPRFCAGERTELAGELVVSIGKQPYPSMHIRLREPWECQIRRDGRVKGLEFVLP